MIQFYTSSWTDYSTRIIENAGGNVRDYDILVIDSVEGYITFMGDNVKDIHCKVELFVI